jgi:hypothetical protein
MRESRVGRQPGGAFLVLNRSCADLQGAIVEIFGDRGDVEVVVDRRKGNRAMPGIAPPRASAWQRSSWRAKLRSVDAELPEQAE